MSNSGIQRGHLAEEEREKEVWALGISINLGIGTFIQVATDAHSAPALRATIQHPPSRV